MRVWYNGDRSRPTDITICPAGHLPGVLPAEWYEGDRKPRTFNIVFAHGYADVSDAIGRYLVGERIASRTSLILPR